MKLLNYTSENFWQLLDQHLSLRQVETSSKIEDAVKGEKNPIQDPDLLPKRRKS